MACPYTGSDLSPARASKSSAPPSDRRGLPAEEVKALLPDELIDELLAGARTEQEIAGPGGLLGQLTKRLVERAMEVEQERPGSGVVQEHELYA